MQQLLMAMHGKINKDLLREIHGENAGTTWDKFFDVDAYVHAAAIHAMRMDEKLPRGARCLDLGCGFGYVALALECLGHTCVAWDTPSPVLRQVAQAIPVRERVFTHIERGGGREEFLTPFDLIILHGVVPLRDAKGWWDWPAYAGLFQKLIRAIKPGGTMEIIANNGDQIPVACDPNNWQALMSEETFCAVSENIIAVRRGAEVCVSS